MRETPCFFVCIGHDLIGCDSYFNLRGLENYAIFKYDQSFYIRWHGSIFVQHLFTKIKRLTRRIR